MIGGKADDQREKENVNQGVFELTEEQGQDGQFLFFGKFVIAVFLQAVRRLLCRQTLIVALKLIQYFFGRQVMVMLHGGIFLAGLMTYWYMLILSVAGQM